MLKKSKYLLAVCMLWAWSSLAAQQAWVAKYGNGSNTISQAVAMALDGNGNIYVAGHATRTNAPHDYDYIVIKYNTLGNQEWVGRYGAFGTNDLVQSMVANSIGEVFLTGTAGAVKFLASGLLAWAAPYAGSDLKLDSEGNLYITGFRKDAYSLVKIAPDGTNVWLRLWNPSVWEDVSQRIAVDGAGNIFVCGLMTDICDRNHCYFQPRIIKYDTSGTLLWSYLLVQGYYSLMSQYKGALCDPQGNLYLGASFHRFPEGGFYSWANQQITASGNYGWAQELSAGRTVPGLTAMTMDAHSAVYYTGVGNNGFETHKLTKDGTNLWTAHYLPNPGFHQPNAVTGDYQGNAYVTGQSSGIGTGNDYVTIKYGTNGQQLWVKRFTEAGNSDDQAHAIAVSPSGDVYVTGFSNPSPGTYEITTIKYIQVAPIEKKGNGNILLNFCGTPTSNYVIQACTILTNWTNLAIVTATGDGRYTFEDTNAPAHAQRFYRAMAE